MAENNQLKSLKEITHLVTPYLTLIIGFVYISGYLIDSIYLRNQGIDSPSLLKAKYIETGLVFTFITAMAILMPLYSFKFLLNKLKSNHNILSIILLILEFVVRVNFVIIFFLTMLFFGDDWHKEFRLWIVESKIRTYFAVYFTGFVIGSSLKALITLSAPVFLKNWKIFITTSISILIITFTIFLDMILFNKITWIRITLWDTVRFYVFSTLGMTIIVAVLSEILKRRYGNESKYNVFSIFNILIYCSFFLIPIGYVMLTNYANRVYTILPANRGGKLPLTQAYITLKSEVSKQLLNNIKKRKRYSEKLVPISEVMEEKNKRGDTIYPFYIIEQNDNLFYVTTDYPAFVGHSVFDKKAVANVYTINRNDIISIAYNKFDVREYYLEYLEMRASSKFQEKEFKKSFTIEKLCEVINRDQYNISLNVPTNTIEWLNDLLEISNFYKILCLKKPNISLSKDIVDLVEKTEEYRNKSFSELGDYNKCRIKRLNRLLLEDVYPKETPLCQ